MDFLFHLSILSSISLQHAHGQLRFNQDSETLFSLLDDFLYVFPLPEGVSIGLPPATSADIIFTSQPPTTGVGDSQISSMLCGMMITRHVMTDTLKHRGTVIRTLIPGLNQYTTPWYTITLPSHPPFVHHTMTPASYWFWLNTVNLPQVTIEGLRFQTSPWYVPSNDSMFRSVTLHVAQFTYRIRRDGRARHNINYLTGNRCNEVTWWSLFLWHNTMVP